MSHATGFVVFKDRSVFWCEYSGTVDMVVPQLYLTAKEVSDNWRSWKGLEKQCACPDTEPVVIYTAYGYGFWWKGTACRRCMLVTGGLYPFNYDDDCDNPMLGRGDSPGDREPWVEYAFSADGPIILPLETNPVIP